MEPFTTHTGLAAAIDRANIDTDAIIPKQFLRKIERTGFGIHLFHEWRYLDYAGTKENPDFILTKEPYRHASVLLARDNFGCGSSREHAPWALEDFGFRVIIAPSFADIFYNNCGKNGILCVKLSADQVDQLFQYVANHNGAKITADLVNQTVTAGDLVFQFDIVDFTKECLLKGLDQIGWTLQFNERIDAYENQIASEKPWL